MNTFKLIISSPDGAIFQDEIYKISLRGVEGELAVMAGHTPFITSVKPGECRIGLPDGTEKKGSVDGGLLTVSKEAVTLLAGSFEWKED